MLPSIETDPMGRPLSDDEARALYRAATQPHIGLYVLLGLGTAARPEALFDLTWDRVDWAEGLIRLAVPSRPQTKKYRPVVRLAPRLAEALTEAKKVARTEGVIEFRGKRVRRLDTGWDRPLPRRGCQAGSPPSPSTASATPSRATSGGLGSMPGR